MDINDVGIESLVAGFKDKIGGLSVERHHQLVFATPQARELVGQLLVPRGERLGSPLKEGIAEVGVLDGLVSLGRVLGSQSVPCLHPLDGLGLGGLWSDGPSGLARGRRARRRRSLSRLEVGIALPQDGLCGGAQAACLMEKDVFDDKAGDQVAVFLDQLFQAQTIGQRRGEVDGRSSGCGKNSRGRCG